MYKTEIYSEDEYLDYVKRHPTHNLLMSNTGLVNLDKHDPKELLQFIKDQNLPIYEKNADDKKSNLRSRRRKMRLSAKLNSLPMDKLRRSMALLVQWPILLHQLQGAAMIRLHHNIVDVRAKSPLVNGPNTMEFGIKNSFDMVALTGKSTIKGTVIFEICSIGLGSQHYERIHSSIVQGRNLYTFVPR